MPAYKPARRSLEGDPLAEIAGLLGPMGLPGAAAGVIAKVGRAVTDPELIAQLDELLGQTLLVGKKTLRLSSFNPVEGIARLQDIESGERIAHPLTELVQKVKATLVKPGVPAPLPEGVTRAATSSGERFLRYPAELASPTQAGTRIEKLSHLGPRGGLHLTRRTIPPTATR